MTRYKWATAGMFILFSTWPSTTVIAQTSSVAAEPRSIHLPYDDAIPSAMDEVLPALSVKPSCKLQKVVLGPLRTMMETANRAAKDRWELRVTSCFRDAEYQRGLFCNKKDAPLGQECVDPIERARVSAPPKHSEHATGYTIDFVVRARPGAAPLTMACPDEPCEAIKTTDVGRWLLLHAREHGFELSFPVGNAQRVKYEPWHWRWVGATANTVGADKARAKFAPARNCFPANPAVAGTTAPCVLPPDEQ